jgi:pyridoxamine 5'-phosphate oxidase-like protein
MPLMIGPELQEFFTQPLLATVCTLNSRGAPEMTPIWYEYVDGLIWFNGTATREWLTRMESTGHATFFLLDRENNWKWAQVWGRVVEVRDDADAAAFGRLGRRYGRAIGHAEGRRYVKLEITSVKGRAGSPNETWDVHA